METTTVKDLYRKTDQYINKEISLKGWVRTVRASKNFGFIEFNDGSFFADLQVVFEEDLPNFKDIGKLISGSAIEVAGLFVESPGAKQPFE